MRACKQKRRNENKLLLLLLLLNFLWVDINERKKLSVHHRFIDDSIVVELFTRSLKTMIGNCLGLFM